MSRLEQGLERVLWGSRYLILIAVVASILVALVALWMATVDVAHLLMKVPEYAAPRVDDQEHTQQGAAIIGLIVKAVDGYLLTAIMLIFALGLYELFIGKIEAAENSEVAARLLLIRSLDDLKDRLAKVVVLILAITFFQHAIQLRFDSALELLYLALGTLLVGGTLFLSSRASKGH